MAGVRPHRYSVSRYGPAAPGSRLLNEPAYRKMQLPGRKDFIPQYQPGSARPVI